MLELNEIYDALNGHASVWKKIGSILFMWKSASIWVYLNEQ